MLIAISVSIIAIQVVLAVFVILQFRVMWKILLFLATSQHTQALDAALYFYKLPAAKAVDYARSSVDALSRAILLKEYGAGYQDWLRARYEHMQSSALAAAKR